MSEAEACLGLVPGSSLDQLLVPRPERWICPHRVQWIVRLRAQWIARLREQLIILPLAQSTDRHRARWSHSHQVQLIREYSFAKLDRVRLVHSLQGQVQQ